MSEIRMKVPDMSCGHCVGAIEGALKGIDGVVGVEANLDTKLVIVRSDKDIDDQVALDSVAGAGYTPEPAG
jgi:copper chaperone